MPLLLRVAAVRAGAGARAGRVQARQDALRNRVQIALHLRSLAASPVMMMVVMACGALRALLQEARKLSALRGLLERLGKLIQRVGFVGVAVILRIGGRRLQVLSQGARHLFELSGVALLKVLESAHQLRKRGDLTAVVGRRGGGCAARSGTDVVGDAGEQHRIDTTE